MRKTFEEYKVGDFAEFKHTITWADINKFVEITGDDNPLHVDKSYADQTSFKGVVAHGMLSAAFFSTMVGKYLPGEGALWVKQNLNFLLPVRPDDELTIRAEITEKIESQRYLKIYGKITNQYGQKVLDGDGLVTVLKVAAPQKVMAISEKPQVVIVTGASRGIGAAVAKRLAATGAKVVVNYASDKSGAEDLCHGIIQAGGTALAVQADVAKEPDVEGLVNKAKQHFGYITGLVNNASPKLIMLPFQNTKWDEFEKHLSVQVRGMYNCVQKVLPVMIDQKYGSVVTVASVVTDTPNPNFSAYTTAKSALIGLSKTLALEYGPKGIRFNIVSPGFTDTQMVSEVPEKVRLLVAMQTPLRTLATPDDIAASIEFLLNPHSKHITGEILRVAGGQVML